MKQKRKKNISALPGDRAGQGPPRGRAFSRKLCWRRQSNIQHSN